jgi:nicotinate dehydrogenase subunit A
VLGVECPLRRGTPSPAEVGSGRYSRNNSNAARAATVTQVTETITLRVNGVARTLQADPETPLLDVLRGTLSLTAAHFGCGENQCGACHVLIDDHALPACDTPLWSAVGKDITTVEGLGTPERPHALQRAFIAEQAAQCGYCTSGILISAAALLKRRPEPNETEVRAALDRNLCRCGAHNRIVRAILRAAKEAGTS